MGFLPPRHWTLISFTFIFCWQNRTTIVIGFELPRFTSFHSTKINKENLILLDTVFVVVVKFLPLLQIAQCTRRRMYCLNFAFLSCNSQQIKTIHWRLVVVVIQQLFYLLLYVVLFSRFTFPTVQTFERRSAWVEYRLNRPKHTPVGFWLRFFHYSTNYPASQLLKFMMENSFSQCQHHTTHIPTLYFFLAFLYGSHYRKISTLISLINNLQTFILFNFNANLNKHYIFQQCHNLDTPGHLAKLDHWKHYCPAAHKIIVVFVLCS